MLKKKKRKKYFKKIISTEKRSSLSDLISLQMCKVIINFKKAISDFPTEFTPQIYDSVLGSLTDTRALVGKYPFFFFKGSLYGHVLILRADCQEAGKRPLTCSGHRPLIDLEQRWYGKLCAHRHGVTVTPKTRARLKEPRTAPCLLKARAEGNWSGYLERQQTAGCS